MVLPDTAQLMCPLCGLAFEAQEMGQSYTISGVDTDLRERGSVEEVRRFAVTVCPGCGHADFSWDFSAPLELTEDERARYQRRLAELPAPPGHLPSELRPFAQAARAFELRGLDVSAQAELALLSSYVARDIESPLARELQDRAAQLFEAAAAEELSASPLSVRYAYLAGELLRRCGREQEALPLLDRAIDDAQSLRDDNLELPGELDLLAFALRQRAEVLHGRDSSRALAALCRVESPEVRVEVARLLAQRRDPASLELIPEVFLNLDEVERLGMLRAFADEPHPQLRPLLRQALRSRLPECVRLAARALAELADASDLEPLLRALERGLLTTEAPLIEAIRRIDAPEAAERIAALLAAWEGEGGAASWSAARDLGALRNYLYTCGQGDGLDRLRADLERVTENDVWDKVPFGSPIAAAVVLADDLRPWFPELLSHENPATRRWAAHIVAELEDPELASEVAPLLDDEDPIVRLQAIKTIARLGGAPDIDLALETLDALGDEELPFALHALVGLRSTKITDWLHGHLASGLVTTSEALPLLGRQAPDPRTAALIDEGLEALDEDSRAGAITALAFQGRSDACERLERALDEDASEAVRRRAIFGLARLAERDADRRAAILTRLCAAFEGDEARLRFPAALALLHLGDDRGIEVVRQRAAALDESLDHYDLVAPAVKALSRYERSSSSAARSESRM